MWKMKLFSKNASAEAFLTETNNKFLIPLIKTFVRSHLNYGIP